MNYSLQYIRIELKRAAHALMSGMVTLIIISVITLGSAAALYTLLQSLGISEPVKIAVSTPGEGNMAKLAIRLLQGMDSIKVICEFELTDEQDAREGVYSGKYEAAIVLPENFYEGVNTGENPPALILIPEDMSGSLKNFGDLLEASVSLVDTVEGGIYAVSDAYYVYGMTVSKTDMENYLTNISFDTLLNRIKFFDEELESSLDVDNLITYAVVSACLLILMVTCTGFGYLYSKRSRTVEYLLKRNGISAVKKGFVRLFVMMLQLFVVYIFFMLVIFTASKVMLSSDKEVLVLAGRSLLDALDVLKSVSHVLPVLLSLCGFTHFIYSLLGSREDTGLILLIVFMIMLIVGGCIVPSVFLPDSIENLGAYMPAALWRNDIFSGGSAREIIMGVLFFAGGEGLTCLYT